jgi:hypothetical protein
VAAETMGKINEGDKKELERQLKDTNDLYSITKGMRNLKTGQIKEGSKEYEQLIALGKKYDLDKDSADYTGRMIAYGIGAIAAAYGAKLGRRVVKVVPLPGGKSKFSIEDETKRYLEGRIGEPERDRNEGRKKSGLENSLTIIIVLATFILALTMNFNFTGFSVKTMASPVGFSLSNTILLLWIGFLFIFITSRHIYKHKKP